MSVDPDHSVIDLPGPNRERWQPLRCGLLNLYRYDDEVFHFVDGRLLIRGNNGTGKSRVLALTLPFLLDGEIDPRRVEPDRDPAKRMEWNLLLGQYQDRTGYTWIEFGRRGPDGDEFLTLGCGMRAIKEHGAPGRWYFITPERIGAGLRLLVGEKPGRPMSRDQLEVVLTERGKVFRKPDDYRAEVDKRLFRLGLPRYNALLQLLIQLRQPQLARELKEETLSRALSEALSPLGDALLDDVALAFRALESERIELAAYVATRKGVEDFRKDYAAYLRCAARRRAQALRSAHRNYEQVQRAIKGHEDKIAALAGQLGEAQESLRLAGVEQIAATAALRGMEDSEEIKSVRALEQTRQAAKEAEERSAQAEIALASARQSETVADENLIRQQEQVQAGQKAFERQREQTRRAAEQADLAKVHAEAWDNFTSDQLSLPSLVFARRHAEHGLQNRVRSLEVLQIKIVARDAVQRQFEEAERAYSATAGRVARLAEEIAAVRTEQTQFASNFLRALAEWCRSLTVLKLEFDDAWCEAIVQWCETHTGNAPWAATVADAQNAVRHALAAGFAGVEQLAASLAEEAAQLAAARKEVAAGRHAPPPPPYTRQGDRTNRPGAPLWQLCEFQDRVTAADQAALEAALEAAGLLDAWILPDGVALDPLTQDTFIDPKNLPALPASSSLHSHLKGTDAAVGTGLERLLSVIGVGEQAGTTNWVDTKGRWRVGPKTGRWSKSEASHIGEGQREAARQRRLAEIEAAEDELEKKQEANQQARQLIQAQTLTLAEEMSRLPSDTQLRQLFTRCDLLQSLHRREDEECRAALDVRDTKRAARDRAESDLKQDAKDLGLPGCESMDTWHTREKQMRDCREAETSLGHIAEAWLRSAENAKQFEQAAQRARETASQLATQAHSQADAATAARSICEALESKLGATEAELLAKLEAAQTRASNAGQALEQARSHKNSLESTRTAEETHLTELQPQLREKDTTRNLTIPPIRHLVANRLLPEIDPELGNDVASEWSVTHAVHVARRLEEALSAVPAGETDWSRHLNEFQTQFQSLQDAVQPHGYRPKVERPDEGLFVVTCAFQGQTCSMAELHAALTAELTERSRLLDSNERKVIENHLLGEVASQLQAHINAAEKTVENMNAELHSRPNSTGLRLQFKWEPDPNGPAGLDEARTQLRKTTDLWTPAERDALADFLQKRINDVKAQMPEGTAWKDLLGAALDYRTWHRFHIERQQDGVWKRLTRRTYGTGSGGEKALMLTLPQVAAAAAHYRSASPEAPRLILLDEVFVGIDNDARAKCLGLLAAFDLDVVMTSEREWGIYPTVPGLGIYQLSARAGLDAIGVVRWVWNGKQLDRIGNDSRPVDSVNAPLLRE